MHPTPRQLELYRKYERMFGRTAEWRATASNVDFTSLDPRAAFERLGRLMDAVKHLTFVRLPRSAGLPQTQEERDALYKRAFLEERVARAACPDDERETWCADTRPPAMGTGRPYTEQNPWILEDLEADGYIHLPHNYDEPKLLVA